MNKQCVYGVTRGSAIGYIIIIVSYCILEYSVVVIRKIQYII